MTAAPETRLGRYEILAELGRGTTAVVYKAWDAQLDRVVAVKIFRRDLGAPQGSSAGSKGRFQQEAMAAGRLAHRSIVGVYDVGEIDGTPYIVMEYVAGRTLADLLTTSGPLHAADAVRLALPLCEALEYAHGHGIVHRDIKPGNILVGEDGVAKLTDFGIARIVGLDHTQTGTMLGTPAYMSPEQVKGQAADAGSDVFALGVVLYEALTGVSPFKGEDVAAVLYQIVHVDPVRLRDRNGSLSRALEAVVARALAKNPGARYPSARALADALTQALRSPNSVSAALGRAWRGRGRAGLRRPLVAASLAGVLVLGFGAWARSSRLPEAERMSQPRASAAGTETRQPAAGDPAVPRQPEVGSIVVATSPSVEGLRTPTAQPSPGELACLSVNAIPFATVHVDGRPAGHTPKACLRVAAGARRVHFEANGERSPERVIRVTPRHTAKDPVRLSYDFTSGRFVDE